MAEHLLRSFGRTKGRALSLDQANAIGSLLGELRLNASINSDTAPTDFMIGCDAVWLEIGFGGAEHLIEQAKANPRVLFIGAEPFMDGVAKALRQIQEFGLDNIRLIDDDARPVISKFSAASIDRIFILFPDPWQKAKHNKRRILNDAFINEISRLLKPGGRLRFASDWADYVTQVTDLMAGRDDFIAENAGVKPSDSGQYKVPIDHFTTRYEEKGLGDCLPVFLDFIKA